MPPPGVGVKVVNHVSAAHDQDSLITQRRETSCGVVMKLRGLSLIDAELHHWNVRFREDVDQHRPCPVVETPGLIEPYLDRGKERLEVSRERGISRCVVTHCVQLTRESAEIVNGARTIHCRD